ncbi:MAG: Rieske (2Fe-2S) protein [Chloroflexota bacterium]
MTQRSFNVCKTSDVPLGGKKIVEIKGRSIGVFNINGEFFALHNRCPHEGAELCKGPVTGTAMPTNKFEYIYGYEGELVRCAWHGWEFEIKTGKCLVDQRVKAKKYRVTVENEEDVVIHI